MKKVWMIALMFLLLAGFAASMELAGVRVPDAVTVDGNNLVLNGLGLRSATIFGVKVYVAALFLPAKSTDPQQILNMTGIKLLRLQFLRDVGADKIREAWTEGISKNADAGRCAASLAQLNAMMADIKNTDVMDLVFKPTGVTVLLKGVNKGTVADPAFARALLSVWLGPNPPNADLKTGILGR